MSQNPTVKPHSIGQVIIEDEYITGSEGTPIYYTILAAKLIEPIDGQIEFSFKSVDINTGELTYSFNYTEGQPPSLPGDPSKPAEGGSIGQYVLPIFMPFLDESGACMKPTKITLYNAIDKKVKKGKAINPTTITKPVKWPPIAGVNQDETSGTSGELNVLRVFVSKLVTKLTPDGSKKTDYFVCILAETDNSNMPFLSLSVNGSTINCSYQQNLNGTEGGSDYESISAVGIIHSTKGQFTKVKLPGSSNFTIKNSDYDHAYDLGSDSSATA